MAEFTLPKNSVVKQGQDPQGCPPSGAAKKRRNFKVYRYDPDSGENPRYDTFEVDLDDCGPMVLDALIKMKSEQDSSLTFRRSCREGICGSCSMNIDGTQRPRLHHRDRGRARARCGSRRCRIWRSSRTSSPISRISTRNMPRSSRGCRPSRRRPRARSGCRSPEDRAKLDGLYECILCACCSTSCPSYWWNSRQVPGAGDPAPGLSLAGRQPRRDDRRAARRARGSVPPVSLPHDHELRQRRAPRG